MNNQLVLGGILHAFRIVWDTIVLTRKEFIQAEQKTLHGSQQFQIATAQGSLEGRHDRAGLAASLLGAALRQAAIAQSKRNNGLVVILVCY